MLQKCAVMNMSLIVFVLVGCYVMPALARPPLPVIVVSVEKQSVDQTIEALGTLRANETAQISATMTERIAALHFSDTQRVKQGDLLIELSNREQLALLEEAHAELDNAQRQLERAKQLLSNRHVSQSDLDTRTREADAALARVRVIESRLAERQIRAPFDGVTGLRRISVGALVTPGTPLLTLHDDRIMKLDFSIPETRLAEIAVGQSLTAHAAAYPGTTFTGEILSVDNQIDPVTRSVVVRALLPNPERLLKPGMLMTLRITVASRQAMLLPEEAVMPVADEAFVMVVNQQSATPTAERRKVALGPRRPGAVEVLNGLSQGELVIAHGNFQARPGQAVNIRGQTRIGEPVRAILAGS